MRALGFLLLGILAVFAFGQGAPSGNLFMTVKPQAIVVVQKHPLGPDMVEITLLDAGYPPALLREQIDRLGRLLGSTPRAVQVFRYRVRGNDPKSAFLRGTFTVDGLILSKQGRVRIGPIVRALAGAPPPYTLSGIDVLFRDVPPGPEILSSYVAENGSVRLQAQSGGNPPGIEYRVRLLSQDPAKIDIPDAARSAPPPTRPSAYAPPANDWTLLTLIGVAALAVGALVYSVLSRSRPKPRPDRRD